MLKIEHPHTRQPVFVRAGSLLWRKDVHVGAVEHFGVLVLESPPTVAHISKDATGVLVPLVEPFDVFAAGREVTVEAVDRPVPLHLMWERIEAVAKARKPYGLMAFGAQWNCESFARYVQAGQPRSIQAEKGKEALVILGAVACVILLAAALEA